MLPRRARDAKVRLQMQRTLSGRHPGSGNQFGTIDHFGLGENIAQVRFYRRERDIQLAGNQLIAGAFAHHADDFPLFRRQDGGQIIFFLQAVANGQLYQRQHRLGPLALFAGERHVAHQRDTERRSAARGG